MSTIAKLNSLQADAHVFYVKVHNLHWNIKGKEFYAVHEYTEKIYTHFSGLFDELAERALQLEGKALVNLKEILAVASIKELENKTFTAKEVATTILDDYEYFLKEFKALSKLAEGDATTVALADENVAHLEKELWMLKSFLA